jgi:hypothetical protein
LEAVTGDLGANHRKAAMRAPACDGNRCFRFGPVEDDRFIEQRAFHRGAADLVAEGTNIPLIPREALGRFERIHAGPPVILSLSKDDYAIFL